MISAHDLDRIPALQPLSVEDKTWLAAQATERTADVGEVVFEQGQPADTLFCLIEGAIAIRGEQDGRESGYFMVEQGSISGLLPRSRMQRWIGTGRAVEPVRAAMYHQRQFDALIERIPALDGIFAAALADRIRSATRMEQQRDKLMALGKLSAGLAHELNNPAAAIRRTVAALRSRLDELPARVQALTAHNLDPDQLAFACTLGARIGQGERMSPVQRAEREDALADWLEARGVEDPACLAETFVEAGFDEAGIESLVGPIEADAFPAVLHWVEASLAADLMLRELAASADRISGIVQSVKRYSHMDQASVHEPTDVHEGLDSTLTMLAYEIRKHQVRVVRQYAPDLPRVDANAGQLNQVWTNLIDNAVDAMPEGGELKIVTRREGDTVLVEIIDTGTGIPEDVQGRIFEPFFTTKNVGDGTGLGLDVVHRIVTAVHGGQVLLRSEPGCTNFTVCLPIHAPGNGTEESEKATAHADKMGAK